MEFSSRTVERESFIDLSKSKRHLKTYERWKKCACISQRALIYVIVFLLAVAIYQHISFRELQEAYRSHQSNFESDCNKSLAESLHSFRISKSPSRSPTAFEFPSCLPNYEEDSKIIKPLPDESDFINFSDFSSVLVGENTFIPKIIYQTGENWNSVPKKVKKSIEKMKSINPGWEYRFYNDDNVERFIRDRYGDEMVSTYLRINPRYGPSRADFFRYLLIYSEGGAYFDLKSTMKNPLNDILGKDDKFILSHWEAPSFGEQKEKGVYSSYAPYGEFQQWHIIAAPKHPFLHAVIEEICYRIHNFEAVEEKSGKLGALHTTGPYVYTEAIHQTISDEPDISYTAYKSSDEVGLIYSCCGSHTSSYVDVEEQIVLPEKQSADED